MPSPREIALKVNESSLFANGDQGYDAEAGCPTADAGSYLKEARIASGGLDDDPSDSGAPVKNRHSFANLKGGR